MSISEHKSLIELLISRLERISVDSFWAHQASGLRGSLFKILEDIETGKAIDESALSQLSQKSFEVLEFAITKKSKAKAIYNG